MHLHIQTTIITITTSSIITITTSSIITTTRKTTLVG
jgi:hypothetical protein